MIGSGFRRGWPLEVGCTVDIEESRENLFAHVDLGDLPIGPGDSVRVHEAPLPGRYGERVQVRSSATIERAGWLERVWTRLISNLELAELYEVGFSPRRMK